jgi:hypothetical protein
MGEASKGFVLLAFISCQLLLPSRPLAPSSPQGKVQPFASLENPMPEPMYGMDEREKDEK